MRILSPNEQRQVEQLKKQVVDMWGDDVVTIPITMPERELWLNLLEIILKKNDEMKDTWRKSANPQI